MVSENKNTTAQLDAWRGDFGDRYMGRNPASEELIKPRVAMWSRILRSTMATPPGKILDVGGNIGLNIRALQRLHEAEYSVVEPNARARQLLVDDGILPPARVHDGFAARLPFADRSFDLVYTSVVLIHVHPDNLLDAYREIHRVSSRYVLSIEYFSKIPQEIQYRGHDGLLFKRDFGRYWLENFPDLRVVDYGFFWEPVSRLDDYTWWLFTKVA